jgi:hypothetical protein
VGYYSRDGIAIAIIHEGQRRGITQKGIQIALSTGLVESDLVMHCNDNDPESKGYPYDAVSYDYDSSGVFQQRPAYWGTCQQRMDVAASAGMFYDSLVAQRIGDQDYNTDATTPGGWAYMVQKCAEEYAYRYDERYPEACEIYSHLSWMECPHQPGECRVSGPMGPLVSKTWMAEETSFGELILPYNHDIVPQETGYWCGPASTQVVLDGQGHYVSEQQLANEMGTHSGGTDYIGQIETVLDHRVPHMSYITVDQPYDPMSHEDKERLWANLVRSMADEPRGGVVMNWVAPPGNYPIGIKGSESPHYGGGTIYHYVACMGIDDNPEQRACWIADSGFYPFGYWCAFDQVSTLIPPKGYCYAATEPTGAPVPPPTERLTYDILSYEQMCGPRDPATGYGTGWAQLGQNAAGQNLYMVDALGAVKKLVEGRPVTSGTRSERAARELPDYLKLDYEQLAGPVTEDGYGHGWPQLDGLTVTDAVASIKKVLEGSPPIPPEGPPEGGTPTDRHALLTCSGTWAPPGVGFPSDVAHGCSDVCEEIPVQAPWSFGPLGGAGDQGFHSPSYKESVQIGVDWSVDWLLAHPNRTFLIGGYSQGGECASRIWQETQPGGRLESVAHNFIGGYTFGNPSRLVEHTFHAGPPRKGEGIAQYRMPPPLGDWWADELDPGDMYAAVPTNLAGEIMRDVYTMCVEMEMHSGAAEFAQTFAANCAEIVQNLDGDAYDDVEETAATMGADLSGARRLDVSGIAARLGGEDDILSARGIAAAIEAAILAIIFFAQGTRPHIEYHLREVFPGQTYLAHAIQHVHHWANTRVPTA